MKKFLLLSLSVGLACAHDLEQIFSKINDFGAAKAASLQARSAASQNRALKGSYLPQIDLALGAKASKGGVDLFEPKYGASAQLEVQWLLFDSARDFAVRLSENAAELAAANSASVRAQAKLNAAKSYYSVLALNEALAAAASQCSALERASADAQKLANSGIRAKDEALLISAAASSCVAKKAALEANLTSLKASISALIGEDVQISAQNGELKTAAYADSTLQPSSEQAPQILLADAAHKIAASELKMARAEFLPKVFLQANAGYEHAKLRSENFGPLAPLIEQNAKPNAGKASALLGVKMNLFSGGSQSAKLEAAKLSELASAQNAQAARSQIDAALKAANARAEAALIAADAAAASAEAAEAAAASLEAKYLAGLARYTEFLRANADAFSARAELAAQLAAAASAKAERSYILGGFNE